MIIMNDVLSPRMNETQDGLRSLITLTPLDEQSVTYNETRKINAIRVDLTSHLSKHLEVILHIVKNETMGMRDPSSKGSNRIT